MRHNPLYELTMPTHNQSTAVSEEQLEDLMRSRQNDASVPVLTHRAEDVIRRQLRDVAMRGCASEIRAFADCARDKLLSVAWKCHSLNKQVDNCMKKFKEDERLIDELRRRSVHAVLTIHLFQFALTDITSRH